MAKATYYFNSKSTSVWTDSAYMIDGILTNYATTASTGDVEILDGNACPGDNLGPITKVEIRVYGYGDVDDRIDLTPVFSGGDGDEHQTTPGTGAGWSTYIDITSDTNAEDWAEWSDIQGIDCKVKFFKEGKANTMHCAKVEIRVTFTTDIDIGAAAIDRGSALIFGFTRVDKNNPANAGGSLWGIEVYAAVNIEGLRVGTFYITNGNTFKCRDSAVIGNVTAGSDQTFTEDSGSNPLSIAVAIGDYIGCYFTAGEIERDTAGFDGYWTAEGEHIDPNDEADYIGLIVGDAISLYGYGDFVVAPPRYGFVNFQDPGIV